MRMGKAPPPVCLTAPGAPYPWGGPSPPSEGGAERRDGARCLRGTVACAYARLDALEASNVPCDRDVSPLGAPPRHFSRRTACRQRHEAFVRGARQRPRRWSRTTAAAGSRSLLRLQDRLRKTPLDEPGCDVTNILIGMLSTEPSTAVHRFSDDVDGQCRRGGATAPLV